MSEESTPARPYPRVQIDCSGGGLVKQSFRDEADVNVVVRRNFGGRMPPLGIDPSANYGDFTNVDSYHEGMAKLVQAQEAFAGLSSEIRARFGNDPGAFVDFLGNPDNIDEARELGILAPAPEVPPGEETASETPEAPETAPSETA